MPGSPKKRARQTGMTAEERNRQGAARFAELAAGYLKTAFVNLVAAAEGGQKVEREWVAAGTLLRRDVVRNPDGTPWLDGKGKPAVCQVRTNDLPFDQLVFVAEYVTKLPPETRANEFLVNRPLGTPRPAPEVEAELMEIRKALAAAIAASSARKARPPDVDEPPPQEPPPAPADDDDPE
jgi:hypothetical protein